MPPIPAKKTLLIGHAESRILKAIQAECIRLPDGARQRLRKKAVRQILQSWREQGRTFTGKDSKKLATSVRVWMKLHGTKRGKQERLATKNWTARQVFGYENEAVVKKLETELAEVAGDPKAFNHYQKAITTLMTSLDDEEKRRLHYTAKKWNLRGPSKPMQQR